MTKEGELKKRILGAGYLAEDEPTFIIPESRLQQVLDDAKKDFPRDSHSTHNWIAEVKKWKAKWLGDSE